ncbi:DUF4942 domain-containing protein [Labrys sp. 22185]|uniref:DUF4942 domain-containing protein n=1 Tax=Labrys sp. 22185 TaxID=3453888 RepID=UPI003F83158E
MNAIMPRATVDSIVAHRNLALALYEEAYAGLEESHNRLLAAQRAAHQASPGLTRYNQTSAEDHRKFWKVLDLPTQNVFMKTARTLTDRDVWAHLVGITDLERLMDKKAKDALHQQLQEDPPEVTAENIIATLEQFALDAGMIFRRGIAEAFSNLDRRFRSHDGWKVGSRVILSYAFNEWGSWNYNRNQRDTIQDIERTFMVLEGKALPPSYAGLIGAIEESRRGRSGARQSEVETEYFKVRCYKNGNAHLWFKREDLVREVNKLLGEYYGAPIPEERAPEEDTGLHRPKTTPAKNYGFYPTPDAAADRVIEEVNLYRAHEDPPLRVLEPSAGTGNLARRLAEKTLADREGNEWKACVVDCVEIQTGLAVGLAESGLYGRVIQANFLSLRPDPTRPYDRIVMNPPFDLERDIDHVMHALSFLQNGGELVAVMSAGTEFRATRKSKAFRDLMRKFDATIVDLPAGSFASVGTYCNTIIVRIGGTGRHYRGGRRFPTE